MRQVASYALLVVCFKLDRGGWRMTNKDPGGVILWHRAGQAAVYTGRFTHWRKAFSLKAWQS